MGSDKVISNLLAGVLIAIMNITVAISVAALMFAGADSSFLAPGIVVLLIGTVVVGLGGTLFSGFPGVICAPRSGLGPVFAAIVAGVVATLPEESANVVLPTIIVAIMATSVATGIFLLILGQLRLGTLVRYIPYPVMGGFFAGIGYIFVKGGLTVAMGATPGPGILDTPELIALGLPAIVFALALFFLLNRFDHWATFPSTLIAAFVVFYGTVSLTGQDIDALAAAGWLPTIDASPGILFPIISLEDLGNVDWLAIGGQAGGILVVALLSAIILLLDTSGVEILTRKDLSPDRELKVMGGTNILSGLLGGYPGVHVASDTAFTYKLGGDSRLMGFVYAIAVVSTILIGTDFIGSVPTFILGGLLVYVGIDFLVDWVWKTRHDLPATDYGIVILILAAIAVVDILEGVAFGFAVAIVLFVVNYSRLSVIKQEATGREHASNVDRDLETRERLNEYGDRIYIITLQGFLFFGTADKLLTEIRDRVESHPERQVDFLVLDFHHVSQVDTSAIKAFTKLTQLSDQDAFHICITGASEEIFGRLGQSGFFNEEGQLKKVTFDQLDDGVGWCEEQLLIQLDIGLKGRGVSSELVDLLTLVTGDADHARTLSTYFAEEQFSSGHYLFRQGDTGASMYLMGRGSAAVVIDTDVGERVLRRYRSGAILGEMALYTGDPRSASVVVEQDAVVYRMDRATLESLQDDHPQLAGILHSYIVRLQSERLARANRELQRYL